MSALSDAVDAAATVGAAGDILVDAVAISIEESGPSYADAGQVAAAMARTLPPGSYPGLANYPHGSGGGGAEISIGFWQINVLAHPQYDPIRLATDSLYNARAMWDVSSGGTNFRPWSTWPGVQRGNGVAEARAAIGGVQLPTPTPTPPPIIPTIIHIVAEVVPPTIVAPLVETIVAAAIGLLGIFFRPVIDFLKTVWHDLSAAIDTAIGVVYQDILRVYDATRDAVSLATTGVAGVLATVHNLIQTLIDDVVNPAIADVRSFLEAYVNTTAQELLHDMQSLYNQAVHVIDVTAGELLHDMQGLFNQAVRIIETTAQELLHDMQALFNQAVRIIETTAQELLHDMQALYNQAVHIIEVTAQELVHDIQVAEQAAFDFAQHAVNALYDDAIKPLIAEVTPWLTWLHDVVQPLVNLLLLITKWLVWMSEHAFEDFIGLWDDATSLTKNDLLAELHADLKANLADDLVALKEWAG